MASHIKDNIRKCLAIPVTGRGGTKRARGDTEVFGHLRVITTQDLFRLFESPFDAFVFQDQSLFS